jgi:hypothetical protein
MQSKGKLVFNRFKSDVLEPNPVGDPHTRDLAVYLTPGYHSGSRYPAVFCLIGYGGHGKMAHRYDLSLPMIRAVLGSEQA